MKDEDIFVDIKKILIEDFEVEEDLITTEASFYKDMELDSLDAIDLIVTISNFYNIDIDNKSIEEAKTIQELIDLLKVHFDK